LDHPNEAEPPDGAPSKTPLPTDTGTPAPPAETPAP
jgi:hypothetical protein